MSEETIRKHLRAALDEILIAEESRLHKFYDDRDIYRTDSIKMMDPLISMLNALKAEIANYAELEISEMTQTYHSTHLFEDQKITVILHGAMRMPLSISTNRGRGVFYFEDSECSSVEDVLKLVLDVVGKHIASKQVINERRMT
jgi:hypothetical protein